MKDNENESVWFSEWEPTGDIERKGDVYGI